MSGGSLNYFYCELQDHIGDFGDKELDELVKDLSSLFKDREWYLSADSGVGDWNEARDTFKQKWFTPHGRSERIEKYLAEIGQEVRGSFGIGYYCQHCAKWTKPEDPEYYYGRCEYEKHCLTHRSENSCSKFVKRGDEDNA